MKTIFIKIFLLIFCLGITGNVFAIGMITEPIVIENILRGGEISEIVTVFNPESAEVVYMLGTEGQIAGWAEFFEKENLTTPVSKFNIPSKTYYDVIAKIKVPDGTPNGEYAGEIFVMQAPKEQSNPNDNTVSVSQKVSREVRIKVTDQEVIKLDTTLIPETYDVKRGESLKIKIIYENLGNISLKPDLQLKIVSIESGKTVFNAIFPYSETEEAVKPGERKTMPIFEWLVAGQENGKYRAETKTLIGGKTIEENSFKFNIGNVAITNNDDATSSNNKLLAAVAMLGRGNLMYGWFAIGGFLLFIAIFLILVTKIVAKRREI